MNLRLELKQTRVAGVVWFKDEYHAWLTADDVYAGWRKVQVKDDTAIMCDIEIRSEYQGQGLCRLFIKAVEDALKASLYGTGGFTPEGFRSLAHVLPVAVHLGHEVPTSSHYESMRFVEDFDTQTLMPYIS